MLFDARVKLLDASGAEIPSSPGRPDTETGVFSIHCKHELGRNPTTMRVDVPNCVTKDYPVTRGQLRHQPELELIVTCANIR
jgi:hypothetical protein